MWIETMIKGRFTIKNGDTMVSFDAQREDGRDLAVPEWLVKKSLGDDAQAGLAVRIQVEGQRVTRIERAGSASPGRRASRSPASPPQAASRSSTGAGSPVTRLPYGFVPVNLSYSVTDTPVWHDEKG